MNHGPRGSHCSSATSPRNKKFKAMPTVKTMGTVFEDEESVIILEFLLSGITVNMNIIWANLKVYISNSMNSSQEKTI